MPQRLRDHREHAVDILEHLIVLKSQHPEALPLQHTRARLILSGLCCMLAAIDLDDQPLFQADEVDGIATCSMLATKLMAVEAAPAQPHP